MVLNAKLGAGWGWRVDGGGWRGEEAERVLWLGIRREGVMSRKDCWVDARLSTAEEEGIDVRWIDAMRGFNVVEAARWWKREEGCIVLWGMRALDGGFHQGVWGVECTGKREGWENEAGRWALIRALCDSAEKRVGCFCWGKQMLQ